LYDDVLCAEGIALFQRAQQGTAAHGSSPFLYWASAPSSSADAKVLVGSSQGLALKEDKLFSRLLDNCSFEHLPM